MAIAVVLGRLRRITVAAAGAVLVLAAARLANGAVLQATMTGGLISGDLGGTSFTNAAYSVTASYDPAFVQTGTLAGFPAAYVGVAPAITIDTGVVPLSGTLQPFAGYSWYLVSFAITANDSRSGFFPIDGGLGITNAFDVSAAVPQSPLLSTENVNGSSNANDPATWQTTSGTLNIDASTDAAGTFAIVPEPAGAALVGIALVTLVRRRWSAAPHRKGFQP